jgi:hypothetical protein
MGAALLVVLSILAVFVGLIWYIEGQIPFIQKKEPPPLILPKKIQEACDVLLMCLKKRTLPSNLLVVSGDVVHVMEPNVKFERSVYWVRYIEYNNEKFDAGNCLTPDQHQYISKVSRDVVNMYFDLRTEAERALFNKKLS